MSLYLLHIHSFFGYITLSQLEHLQAIWRKNLPMKLLIDRHSITMILIGLVLSFVFLRISYEDIKTRTISNRLVLKVLFLSVAYAVLESLASGQWIGHLLALLIILGPSILLFATGLWGGGDAKLLIAVSPLAVPHTLLVFLFLISAAGLFQAIMILILRRLRCHTNYRPGMPYGVAICGGSFIYISIDLFYRAQNI